MGRGKVSRKGRLWSVVLEVIFFFLLSLCGAPQNSPPKTAATRSYSATAPTSVLAAAAATACKEKVAVASARRCARSWARKFSTSLRL